jgi:hypothetical protein
MTTRGRWLLAASLAVVVGAALWTIRPVTRSTSTPHVPADARGETATAAAAAPPAAPTRASNETLMAPAKATAAAGAPDAGAQSVRPSEPVPRDAQGLFAEGKKAIEMNLGDAYGATRAKLEQGIAEIQEALRLGHPDRKGGEILIGRAYGAIAAGHVEMGSAEERAVRARAAEAYRAALDIDPSDLELRHDYAVMLNDPAERLHQYREIVRMAPNSGEARFAVASELISTGKEAEGARELIAAVPLFTDRELRYYGDRTAVELRRLGFAREAAKVDERLKALREESK